MAAKAKKVRVLTVAAQEIQERLRRQIVSFGMTPVVINRAVELASHLRGDLAFQVVLLPAALAHPEDWWCIWGDIILLRPKPAILVYAQSATFQLWSGVLEAGGYDVIVEPLTDEKLHQALLRAAESYRKRSLENLEQD